jgi:hypothetical protein
MTEAKFREWLKKSPIEYLVHSGSVYVQPDESTVVVTFNVDRKDKEK